MRTVASTQRPFDPSAAARFMLLVAGFGVVCGLINTFLVTPTNTLLNVLCFGGAVIGLVGAAEFRWLWPRLMERAAKERAKPSA